ncbi:hypothetical protein BAU15_05215 [Enterococcus sp. JM4C]|uniref:MarR family transcriptional regulator n=1 Tax=Candidatus Enterococcus huntleyi TaxID=1857217 RepID=UPI00137A2490|nr:MarR family transcriptional regulator [Enterococcus sp. JM4C]KAF1295153.1 hypothetical protein BAU15_05215 [Enterococcus sp. JM4C]
MNNTSQELANIIEKMINEQVSEQMKILEDTYFAKSKQTLFTKEELANKWRCSITTTHRILKASNIKPKEKSGKNFLFDIEKAEEAKSSYDGEELRKHELNRKVQTM